MKSLLWSLTAGYLLAFYSEFLFYGQPNEPGAPMPAAAWGALLLWYALGTLPAAPVSLLVLPFLLGSGWWALRRHRVARPEGRPDALDDLRGKPHHRNLLALFLWPLVAALEYAAWVGLPWTVLANVVLYLILTPGGLLAYLWALRELRREPSPA